MGQIDKNMAIYMFMLDPVKNKVFGFVATAECSRWYKIYGWIIDEYKCARPYKMEMISDKSERKFLTSVANGLSKFEYYTVFPFHTGSGVDLTDKDFPLSDILLDGYVCDEGGGEPVVRKMTQGEREAVLAEILPPEYAEWSNTHSLSE